MSFVNSASQYSSVLHFIPAEGEKHLHSSGLRKILSIFSFLSEELISELKSRSTVRTIFKVMAKDLIMKKI